MASESGPFANLKEEDLQEIIDNKDSKQTVWLTIVSYILNLFISKMFMRYSKTNTTWFISRSSENSWSRGVGCVRLPTDANTTSLDTMFVFV